MNKKTKRNLIVIIVVLLLLPMPFIPFIYRESQRNVELYVNPAFKISDYDSFYVEYETGSVKGGIDSITTAILRAGGLKDNWNEDKTQKTLYIVLRMENGFIFPPHIGHLNPQIFYLKTLSVEMYNDKSREQLLFKLYTWRGVFSNGYDEINVYDNFIKNGLIQAGWKEKKVIPVSEAKQSGN